MSDGNTKNFTLERADSALVSRDFALAARLYKSVLKDDANNKDILLKLGTCYVRGNQDEKALEPFLLVLSLDNNNFDALNNLGGIYRRLGKYEESVKVLEAALKLNVNNQDVNYNLGHTYKLMGYYDAAAESFYSVIEENPNDVLAYNHLGTIQAARGEYKKALQTYWRALQIDPNHPVLHYNSALSFTALEKFDDAIKAYESALRTKPGWIDALEGYSAILVKTNNYQKAEEVINYGIQISPNNIKLRNLKANIFFKKGCLVEAEDEFKKTLALENNNYDSLNGLTKICEILGRYPEAASLLKELEKVSPNKDNILKRQIALLIYQNKLKEAAILLKSAREKDPENVQIINLLAQFFIRSKEKNKELGCYRLIKNLDPNYVVYLRDCGEQHSKISNYANAENLLERYLEVCPDDTKALGIQGYIAEKKQDFDKALKYYQAVLKIEPENSIALGAISKIGQETGPDSKAMGIITDILNSNTETTSPNLINDSVKTYEEVVKNLESTPIEIEEEPIILDTELSLAVEDGPDVDLDDLFTYDMNESIDFTEFDDEILSVEDVDTEIDEESVRTDNYGKLVAEDLPIDYAPTQKETGYYDPFEGVNDGNYDFVEDSSVVDVDGTPYFSEDDISVSLEEPVKEVVSEEKLTNSGVIPQKPVVVSIPVANPVPASPIVENPVVTKPAEEESIDLTFDVEPEEESPYEEETLYDDLISEDELESNNETEEIEDETPFAEASEDDSDDDFFDSIADFENENLLETENILEETVLEDKEETLEDSLENKEEILEDSLEESEKTENPYDDMAEMFKDLRDLCSWLPEADQREFSKSINKLRLDYLIEKLSGNIGLLKAATSVREQSDETLESLEEPVQKESFFKTMEYLQYLASFLPNPQQASSIERETARILEQI